MGGYPGGGRVLGGDCPAMGKGPDLLRWTPCGVVVARGSSWSSRFNLLTVKPLDLFLIIWLFLITWLV